MDWFLYDRDRRQERIKPYLQMESLSEVLVIANLEMQKPQVFYKESCSLRFRNIHKKTPVLKSFLIKLQAFRPAALLKRDSNTGFFLCMLRND